MKEEWDSLVKASRQGTLLHLRGYMDYHADRFKDCSLIAFRNGTPVALLPANIDSDGRLFSHRGLTYGGWLTPMRHFNANDMLELFDVWTDRARAEGIREIIYKPVPSIYHKIPADEDLYALFRHGATLSTMNLSSTIDLTHPQALNTQQKRNLRKAESFNPWVKETQCAGEFMPLVAECLMERHSARPVHTEEEMQMLKERFPDGIRMFLCGTGSTADAGVCIYVSDQVAHCQYIATTAEGRRHGLLTFLIQTLLTSTFREKHWFDLGTSNEDAGRVLNAGLIRQKTSLGASAIAYPIYKLRIE